jgi:hypothetical protein
MKGKELKTKKIKLILNDGEHEVLFDMNALAEIEDYYGDIQAGMDKFKEKPINAMRVFIYALLKTEKEDITLRQAGALIPTNRIDETINAITAGLDEAMPDDEETLIIEEEGEENSPNA